MLVKPIKTQIFKEGQDLAKFVIQSVPHLKDKDVLIIASKIVALSEKRTFPKTDEKSFDALVTKESAHAIKTKLSWLTLKDGTVMASAGIDRSNAFGKLILLPKNSNKTAKDICAKLKRHYKIRNLGVVISDSIMFPLRAGVVAQALGYSGFKGLKDYRGKKDLCKRTMKISWVNAADSLATTAAFAMGEGAECQPLCIIRNAPIDFVAKSKTDEIKISMRDDLFKPLLSGLSKSSPKKSGNIKQTLRNLIIKET
jgi:dihydrofolate synthase / folylpolyglutamate synthase